MSVYPATPVPSQGLEVSRAELSILCGPYPGGQSIGVSLRAYPLHSLQFSYRYLTDAERQTVLAFYRSQRGRAGTFTIKDWYSSSWTGLYVGVGDGTNRVFDLPAVSSSAWTFQVGVSAETHYTVAAGTGADGRDRVTFDVGHAPGAAAIVEVDLTGCLTITGRLTSDEPKAVEGEAGFWSIGPVGVVEVR